MLAQFLKPTNTVTIDYSNKHYVGYRPRLCRRLITLTSQTVIVAQLSVNGDILSIGNGVIRLLETM